MIGKTGVAHPSCFLTPLRLSLEANKALRALPRRFLKDLLLPCVLTQAPDASMIIGNASANIVIHI